MLKIGIISDTHDDIDSTKKAIEVFNKHDVNYVFHAGDYIFPGIVSLFKDLNPSVIFYGVRGNNDGELLGLLSKFKEIENAEFLNEFGRVIIESKDVGIYHGTNANLTETLIQSQVFDLLILGHTHVRRIDKVGKTLVLNPGALNVDFFSKQKRDYPNIIIYEKNKQTGSESAVFVPLDKD